MENSMLKNYFTLISFLSIELPAMAMNEINERPISPFNESGQKMTLQGHEHDSFTLNWLKVQARLEARIDENQGLINRIQNNFDEEIKVLVHIKRRNTAEKLLELKNSMQNDYVEPLKNDIVFLSNLKNRDLKKFNSSVDDFLFHLYLTCMDQKIYIKIKESSHPGRPDMINDDLTCFRYAIKKLSPYQLGWFSYLEASIEEVQVGRYQVDFRPMQALYEKNFRQFQNELRKHTITEAANNHIFDTFIKHHSTLIEEADILDKNFLSSSKKNPDFDTNLPTVKKLASLYGNMNNIFRQFTSPAIIAHLSKQYPDEKKPEEKGKEISATPGNVTIKKQTPSKAKKSAIHKESEKKKVNQEAQHRHQGILPSLDITPLTTKQVIDFWFLKEMLPLRVFQDFMLFYCQSHAQNAAASNFFEKRDMENIPLEGALTKPKLMVLDLKKQRRIEKVEQQRRAKEWSQQIYKDHLSKADLTSNHDLSSDFKWMNDIVNPDLTITYHSIVGKLSNLTTIKTASGGSRRYFLIKDAPIGRPVACYFHEPHPDEAVKIEKWRWSISEALKKAGYFRVMQ